MVLRAPRRLLLVAAFLIVVDRASETADAGGQPDTEPRSTAEVTDESATSASDARVAGQEGAVEKPYWQQNFFVRIWKDQKPLFLKWWPAEFRRPAFTAPLVAASLFAATSDRGSDGGPDTWASDSISARCTGSCTTAAERLTQLGNTAEAAALLGIGFFVSRMTGHTRFSEATSLSGEALVDTAIYNEALKFVFRRARPTGDSHGPFFNYGSVPEGQELGSFPSGHSQGAFTVAAVFGAVYDDHPWVRWSTFGAATLIATSRVALYRHFPSDVIVGGLLGDSIGRFVVERSRGRPESPTFSSTLLRLHPIADPDHRLYGLVWEATW